MQQHGGEWVKTNPEGTPARPFWGSTAPQTAGAATEPFAANEWASPFEEAAAEGAELAGNVLR